MNTKMVITVIADNRPGIVERLSEIIKKHHGNWLNSSMSRLAGKFAGILEITVAEAQTAPLQQALKHLSTEGIRVNTEVTSEQLTSPGPSSRDKGSAEQPFSDIPLLPNPPIVLAVTGNDRPGIVSEISACLARLGVNVEKLQTYCDSAPMTGEMLFNLDATLVPPTTLDTEQLRENLEALSDDLMVEILLPE